MENRKGGGVIKKRMAEWTDDEDERPFCAITLKLELQLPFYFHIISHFHAFHTKL